MEYSGLQSHEEQNLVPEVQPYVKAIYLQDKYNCVSDDFMEQIWILNHGKLQERVLIAGFDTEACVLSAAISLFDRGIKPYILVDFIASSEGVDNHLCGLRTAETLFGIDSLLKLG